MMPPNRRRLLARLLAILTLLLLIVGGHAGRGGRDLSRPQSFTYNMLRKTSIAENIRQVMGFRLLASRMFPLRGSYAANPGIFPLRRSPWKSKLPAMCL
ncbi:hypothetical protein TRIUR3_03677 [Triticum urartu]|uniref:Uncharacterized protein n=1 Tax=Triticum urartu TaxID=4572 RepID=M8A1M1_TRIUA|nr:hypothetical protein TRIUR3_03677 [Triticum urartu]